MSIIGYGKSMMKLYEKLRENRLKFNLTQSEMAHLLNLSEMTYSFLEYGEPLWDTKQIESEVYEIVKRLESESNCIDRLKL